MDRLRSASASRARLTFIGINGIVWGDTERDGQHLQDMDNHRDRPEEVQEALEGGIGTIDRYSDTVMTTIRILRLTTIELLNHLKICERCKIKSPVRQKTKQGLE